MKRESTIQSTTSNFVASWIYMALSIGTGIIVTRALGPELKGEYSNFILILTVYVPLLVFGYSGGVHYYGLTKQLDLKNFFWSGFAMTLGLGIVLTPLLYPMVVHGWLGKVAAGSESSAVLLALLAAPLILLNAYAERILKSFHLFRASNFRSIAGAVVTLLYLTILLPFVKIDLDLALIGVIVGQATQLIMSIWFSVRQVGVVWSLESKNLFKPWRYGIKTWLSQIVSRSNSSLDRIALTFFLESGPFGLYCVGVALSNLVTKIPSSYVSVFFNQVTQRQPEEALKLYAKAQRITFLITSIMALGLAVASYPLIYMMYGNEFVAAAWVVVLYTPGLVFQAAASLSIKLYAGMGEPLKVSLVYFIGFLVSLPFYLFLVPPYGINGAAVASSIAYFSAFLFSFYQINREFGLPIRNVVGIRREDWRYVQSQLSKLSFFGWKLPA